jgi:predicted enzyme related to lactoylglutathione lyase
MANTARMPGVHPHWLYFFPVADLEGTVAKIGSRGGEVLGSPVTLPNGARVVPCHDPQGAAFGLFQAVSVT